MSFFNFLTFFKKNPPQNLGANLDTRSPYEKLRDYKIEEIVASAVVVEWKEMLPSEVRQFPVQNQNQKSDCVAETRRKLYRILFKVNRGLDLDFSAARSMGLVCGGIIVPGPIFQDIFQFPCVQEQHTVGRSEERRVGKECRSRWSPY